MGLTDALTIGRTALGASQAALQVVGNNMANAATPGYSRQRAELTPAGGQQQGQAWLGRGVRLGGVTRMIDEAVQQRLRGSISEEARALTLANGFGSVESILNELSENDLSSQLTGFFGSWSERSNLVASDAVVVQQGQRLATYLGDLRSGLVAQQTQVDTELGALVEQANAMLDEVAAINRTIITAEQGRAEAGNLRDRRDELLNELSALMDISTIELDGGGIDVLVGSTPVLLGGNNRGLTLARESDNGRLSARVRLADNGRDLPVMSGRIGALLESRSTAVDSTIAELDRIASSLIFEVNRLHSTGTNEEMLASASGTLRMGAADRTLALNDPTNTTLSGLPFSATNGGFLVTVRDNATGAESVTRIEVDLDGRDANGQLSFADDTSAEDIRAALDAIDGIEAAFNPDGTLSITAEPGLGFAFSEDSSGALAVLGVNTFFEGSDAGDITVREELVARPSLVTTGRIIDGDYVENGTTLAIAALNTAGAASLDGESFGDRWLSSVQGIANEAGLAQTRADAATLVRESIEAQRGGLSGVNLDEESINLLEFQRQYQGAARLIQATDEMFSTLLSIV